MTLPELGLQIPLDGVQLIEASAGTGKTHTLATLYARLVIEAGLPIGRILAVTYTRAATAELRDRLRARLRDALERIERDAGSSGDDAIGRLLRAALVRESRAELRARLRRAVAAMDVAPIHTIHAFCQRALADYGLEAGQSLGGRELLANERELRLEVATEFWRARSRDDTDARTLLAIARGPEQLAERLRALLDADALEPLTASGDDSADALLATACDALADLAQRHAGDAREQMRSAGRSGSIHRARSADEKVDAVWRTLGEWLQSRDDALLHDNLFWYGSRELRGKWNPKHGALPQSPLFDAIDAWVDASSACQAQRRREQLAMLHALRGFAVARIAQLKRERGLVGYNDLVNEVAAALAGESGTAFAARLQEQYRVALVDEFQDTDPRQSAIFHRLFGAPAQPGDDATPRALFLIGDPKQAIYRFRGGDVTAYLVAAHRAQAAHSLQQNFRSRPALLTALDALYRRAGDDAFGHPGIAFHPVHPGGRCRDEDLLRAGEIAPALTVLTLALDPKAAIAVARSAFAQACASAILELLQDAARGRIRRRDAEGEMRALQPGDIAVLVETHDDAMLMRGALEALGIPATAPGRESVFGTPQAEELRCLLLALRAPADSARLRAVLATPLFGLDAAALDALDHDEPRQRHWQERLQGWRRSLERSGPLSVLQSVLADAVARLQALPGGERRLANYLQLGEALQELAPRARGVDALLDAFERRIELADESNEDELLRLESDAQRVAIQTLHASKGLEYDVVFLPLIASHGARGSRSASDLIGEHDGEQRLLHVPGFDAVRDEALRERERAEERAERLRLLYVGLTRARLALWIAWGETKVVDDTPLAWLLHRDAGAGEVVLDAARIRQDLQDWQELAGPALRIRPATSAAPGARYVAEAGESTPPARRVLRELSRDWWIYSYSMLTREQRNDASGTGGDELPAEDEVGQTDAAPIEASRFGGARFGNALHAALEDADFAAWRDWHDEQPPPGEIERIDVALRDQGYGGDADLAPGRALLCALIVATLNTPLPEGLRLCDLARDARRDELEFHLSLAPVAIPALLATLHAHGVAVARQGFGLRQRIEGLLTGRIDLLYRFRGRYYVVDYKSNRLDDYRPRALADAVRASEYDLQYVLYTLALHRWLRFRLGDDYDYERDVGGVRYLFSRGLDPTQADGRGIHAARPPLALIDALDALFAGRSGAAA